MKIKSKPFFLVVIIFSIFTACKKDIFLGTNLLPASDDIGAVYSDTFSLFTTTKLEDSVLTSSTVNNLAGSINDPIFGKSYASFFTQFSLLTNDVDFGSPDTLYIDSIVLTLGYAGSYGYKYVPQSFNVYRVNEALSPKPEGGYYNKTFAFDPEPIGRKQNFVPNFTDSIQVGAIKIPAHMRIRLSDRLGQELLSISGSDSLASDSNFKKYFKGIYMSPDTIASPYGSSILYFNLESLLSGIHLYWHTPNLKSLSYVIPVVSTDVRTNYFKTNHNNSAVSPYLQSQLSSDSIVFLQGIGGLKTRVLIPSISSLKNVVINKAEIIITQVNDDLRTDSIFTAPLQIVCVTSDSSGKDISIPDNLETFPEFGGASVKKVTIDRKTYVEYHFSIANQIQQIVDGDTEDRGLFLIMYRRGELPDRLMMGGSNRSDFRKMKFNLIYTPIK